MRISDWSSDVCSSDLETETPERGDAIARGLRASGVQQAAAERLAVDDRHVGGGVAAAADTRLDLPGGDLAADQHDRKIGRAACRERVCSVRVDLGGRRVSKKKNAQIYIDTVNV